VLYSFCGRPLPTASSPLSLHDALPISPTSPEGAVMEHLHADAAQRYADLVARGSEAVLGLDFDGTLAPIVEDPTRARIHPDAARSEEHTSELQSRENLVCRLLLEKKKK